MRVQALFVLPGDCTGVLLMAMSLNLPVSAVLVLTLCFIAVMEFVKVKVLQSCSEGKVKLHITYL